MINARYPALPLLASRFSENGVIIIDDCVMLRWKKMVVKWAYSNGFTVESSFLNEKDALFLQRLRLTG
jgi:hypothetical protein